MRFIDASTGRGLGALRAALAIAFAALLSTGCGPPPVGSIGAVLSQNKSTGRVVVREVPKAMTGAKGGLQVGDELISIEGKDVRDLSPSEVHTLLTGEIGTSVAVTVARGGEALRLTIVRGPYGTKKE